MTGKQLLAELSAEMPSLSTVGGIDAQSVYRWMKDELQRFGKAVCDLYDDVIEVKGGSGRLPDNFYSLESAYRCEPLCYEDAPEGEEVRMVSQDALWWKERTEYGSKWNSCEKCCREEMEKTVIETVYMPDLPRRVRFHYHRPQLLRLGRTMHRKACISDCRNRVETECPWEITISGKTVYANFDGSIYLRYYGVKEDGEGIPDIPDTDLGLVRKYIENYIKMKLFERQMLNNEGAGAAEKFQLYMQMSQMDFVKAMTDAKMTKYDWSVYPALRALNRRVSGAFERG
jgi:hypothetical protein